ncbi:PREDICTED: golgin subfamily A member 2-like [Papilio xuthus]|uniref:Golgin subfamily A member 2-like n=1 Tax=Papilio xuthus TaxID=66420 RepID=A0AAJ6ZY65_PAPXU|nr:PREDICTED: golgin subfamily A member 2-like [Papilio xuthus]
MDERAAKLAAARQKLKHHQEKKMVRTEVSSSSQEYSALNKEAIEDIVNVKELTTANDVVDSYRDNHLIKNSVTPKKSDMNVTEILITNKTKLEEQVKTLEKRLVELQRSFNSAVEQQNVYAQTVSCLQMELQTVQNKYEVLNDENSLQKNTILDLQSKITALSEQNTNLIEQLEFTKTMLTVKENENSQLTNHISMLQNQIDVLQLQMKQLTNNSNMSNISVSQDQKEQTSNDQLYQKISNLEQQMQSLQKERDSISSHYEHYVGELNRQLKVMETNNNELSVETQRLQNRETNLVDQISEMEIRLQNFQSKKVEEHENVLKLQETIKTKEKKIQELSAAYSELQAKCYEKQVQIETFNKNKEINCDQDNISISKLNADIASDKVAAQRATEQNKKLKTDLTELEFAFIKMSKDKLDLTDKLTHEKQLNKELMLKLADIEENLKSVQNKLKAKDDEMIRLQNSCRILENNYEKSLENYHQSKEKDQSSISKEEKDINCNENDAIHVHNQEFDERRDLLEIDDEEIRLSIAKEDAMLKLQERFLNIMDEVANLSDEKHRLEHIILQLQNETDTICEYIALYQQQRSLLKKRDEDRSEQIKMFQIESNKLKMQLEELNDLLLRFANDDELKKFLQDESRKNDLDKVMELMLSVKTSSLISLNHKMLDFKNFYPCNCCSGQLIDV